MGDSLTFPFIQCPSILRFRYQVRIDQASVLVLGYYLADTPDSPSPHPYAVPSSESGVFPSIRTPSCPPGPTAVEQGIAFASLTLHTPVSRSLTFRPFHCLCAARYTVSLSDFSPPALLCSALCPPDPALYTVCDPQLLLSSFFPSSLTSHYSQLTIPSQSKLFLLSSVIPNTPPRFVLVFHKNHIQWVCPLSSRPR